MIGTADGWCGYPSPATADGWPKLNFPVTADGFVIDSDHRHHHHNVGGPLFREKKRRLTLPVKASVDLKEIASKARIRRAERLASRAVAKAIAEAQRVQRVEAEAERIAHEAARQEALREAKRKAEEKAIAQALKEAKERAEAKQKAITEAKRLAEEAAEAARVLAAEEQLRQRDEKFLNERLAPQLLKELDAIDAKFGSSVDEVLALLEADREELEAEPKARIDTKSPVQRAALEALQEILETTRRLH